MKILQINKFFYLHGGGARYFLEVSKLLNDYNHEIAFFSMEHPRNKKTKWSKYFVSNATLERPSLVKMLKVFGRMIFSFEVKKNIFKLLNNYQIDITHLHSIAHQLSPSIILELKKRNIPLVQTIHEYHLISPTYNMFHNGKICEITKPKKFYRAVLHKCVKDSYLASLAEVLEKYLHYLSGWDRKYIDTFIAPSKFMKGKLIEYGLPQEKIIYLPNFINYHSYVPTYDRGDYILYFGRLSEEKGLNVLLKAMKLLPKLKLKIVGRGLEYDKLKQLSYNLRLENVELLGFLDGEKLKRVISNCRFTVLPSVWYENSPNCVLESFASGKPVIASNIGGIPEIVRDGFNGFIFEPGNVEDCAEKINKLWSSIPLCREMGKNAREYEEKHFSPEEHYERLVDIYKMAIEKHKR